MERRNCLGEDCSNTFIPTSPLQKYCSAACRIRTHRRAFYRKRLLLFGTTKAAPSKEQLRFCFRLGCGNVVRVKPKRGRPPIYCSARCRRLAKRFALPQQPSVPFVSRVLPTTVAEARARLHYHLTHCPVQIGGMCPAAFFPSRHRCLHFAVYLDDYYQLRGHPRRWTLSDGTWKDEEAAKAGPRTVDKLYEWASSLE